MNEMILAIRQGTSPRVPQQVSQRGSPVDRRHQFLAGKESTQEEFFHTVQCAARSQPPDRGHQRPSSQGDPVARRPPGVALRVGT
jgi:hypothetical protein